MEHRKIQSILNADRVSEGAGVIVYRSIGSKTVRDFDPFLMLDQINSANPDEYIAGFPAHPHRGFTTLTYMIKGHMRHEDSMGNKGNLESGGVQWMKAASGVIHSEMPVQSQGEMQGFQLWINLPQALKMSSPAYRDFAASQIADYQADGITVKLISGTYENLQGPVIDEPSQLLFLHVSLASNKPFEHQFSRDMNAFIYSLSGQLQLADRTLSQQQYGLLSQGDTVSLQAGEQGAEFLLIAGKPMNEAVARHGPFVMNTQEEIEQAIADYNSGSLVRERASDQAASSES